MFLTRKRAFARAALLGNPSDGYGGKTISISVRNYWAEVVLYEWDSVEIVLADDDRAKFDSVYELARDVRRERHRAQRSPGYPAARHQSFDIVGVAQEI